MLETVINWFIRIVDHSLPYTLLLPVVMVTLFPGDLGWAQTGTMAPKNPSIWADVPVSSVIRVGDALFDLKATNTENPEELQPSGFKITKNYPNPFNPSTQINFIINRTANVRIDVSGRHVSSLVNEVKAPGNYTVTFNTKKLASGFYLYRMQAGNYIETTNHPLIDI